MTTSSSSAAGLLSATRRALTHRVAVGQAEGRTPSLAAAVVRDGGQAWFGARSMLEGHEPDGHTQYRIGSLTKTFIAVLVMRLRDEGRLDLADPLGKHLDAGEAAGATIAQLLSHTAGLASETPGPWWERSPGELRPGLADILSPAPHPAGRLFHYSNPGYGLLGALVGQLRGYGWEEALRQEILDPLGMARTTLTPEEPHARGFAVHPWADVMQLEPADPAGLMAPAGELWSTADDLCRFAVFLLDGDDRVLPERTLDEMRAPASPPGDEAWEGGYGLGLQLFRYDGRMLYGHSGSMPGFLATLCVSPADGVGGITLANATSGLDIAGIAIDLVRIVADNEPRLPDRWQPLPEVDQALLALTGPWYWGPRAYVLRLVADRGLELGPATGRGRTSRFRAEPDGTWTGLDGYYTGETLRLVRGPDGTVHHLDLGSFVFTREPYGPDAPLAARPDPEGWRAFLGRFVPSDRIAGGFGGVGPAGRGCPPEGPVGKLVDFPAGLLFEPMIMTALRLLSVILTHMTIRDAIQLAEASRPPDGVIRCLIYVRISMDKAHDGHGVANQMAKLEQKARERGWTVVYQLSDNDIGVTRKDPTRPGKYRPGYEEAMRLVDARAVDAVLCFKWDRFIREPLDLEYLIPRFDKAGVRFAEVDGNIDLGTDSGRLHARILIAVAKAEQERKAERQKLANEQAAINGHRFLGGPRPFGYGDDHVTAHPVEGPAVAEACAALLGGGTVSGVMREWTRLELTPPQQDRRGTTRWNRASIRSILLNPKIAGLSVYHGEIVGQGQWEPLVSEETWRAVRGVLEDPARKPPRGVRTLLGGLALCPCGNVVAGGPSHTGHRVYRCSMPTRDRSWPGEHVARQAEPVEDFITRLVTGRLARADAADLVAVPDSGPDVVALREEATAIRKNLEEMAADRALGLITRPQLLAATGRASLRLDEIGAELETAARENVLAPLVAAENAAAVWETLDLSRQRAIIKTLMGITLHSPGRGARRPFDPATVTVTWKQPG